MKTILMVLIFVNLPTVSFAAAPITRVVDAEGPIAITCDGKTQQDKLSIQVSVLRVINGQTAAVVGYGSGGEEILKLLSKNCIIQPNYIVQPSSNGAM